jgi:hypothetical protein
LPRAIIHAHTRTHTRARTHTQGVITFSPHELPACVILPPRITTSTKKEHQTTIFIYFGPFRQEIPLTWMEYVIFYH